MTAVIMRLAFLDRLGPASPGGPLRRIGCAATFATPVSRSLAGHLGLRHQPFG
jgi:hypothetical protein